MMTHPAIKARHVDDRGHLNNQTLVSGNQTGKIAMYCHPNIAVIPTKEGSAKHQYKSPVWSKYSNAGARMRRSFYVLASCA